MNQQQQQQQKRVTLNRRNSSSLVLDYQAVVPLSSSAVSTDNSETTAGDTQTPFVTTNEYTRQLVASALSLPPSLVNITTTTRTTTTPPPPVSTTTETDKDNKNMIELPLILPPPLLKSSLRNPTKIAASAPCSPGIKSVKFNTRQLEEICLFRKASTPLAISQKTSIFWWGDEDDDEEDTSNSEQEEPIKTLVYVNWPTRLSDILDKKNKVIRIEKSTIKLDTDFDQISGKILVKNLDYHKAVTIRYTFDFWETMDNISATYQQHTSQNYDVFLFQLKLPPSATTLYFAVNYKVGQQEFWENNDGRNYEVQIKGSAVPVETSADDAIVADKPTTKKSLTAAAAATQQQDNNNLKSRYDFSTSIHQARTIISTQQQQRQHHHKKSHSTNTIINNSASSFPSLKTNTTTNNIPFPASSITTTTTTTPIAMPVPIRRSSTSSSSSPTTGLSCHHSPISSSPVMDLNSQSYLELVNKYCFYSTSPSSSRSPMSIGG